MPRHPGRTQFDIADAATRQASPPLTCAADPLFTSHLKAAPTWRATKVVNTVSKSSTLLAFTTTTCSPSAPGDARRLPSSPSVHKSRTLLFS